MRLITFLLQSSWKRMSLAILMGVCSGGSSAGLIALINHLVGKGTFAVTMLEILTFTGLALVVLVTSIVARVLLIQLSQDAVFALQLRLSQQILAAELHFLEELGTPRLLANLTEDVQAITNAVVVIPVIGINLAIATGCLLYLTWLSWQILLGVLGVMILAIASCRQLLRRGRRLLALAREEQDQLFKHFRALTEGIKQLKLHWQRRADFLHQDLRPTATTFRHYSIGGLIYFAATDSWGKLIFFLAVGVILLFLPRLVTLEPQQISGYVLTFTYLLAPMENIVNKLPFLGKATVALDKIEGLGLTLAARSEALIPPAPAAVSWAKLELQQVTHTYRTDQEDRRFRLGPLSLTLYPGQLVFIVGGNGSGKSTLAKVLTGLYQPESGEIRFQGQVISAENREWYRQHFAAVFSDFYLFERLLGAATADLDAQASVYLQQLRLDHKVRVSKGRLSTTELSQGQRKRLTLLSAYLEDRPIYLFDEWAADQDPEFKEVFYHHLLPQLRDQGKTVLVITHDDHYFHVADRILKLHEGQLEFDRTPSADPKGRGID